MYSGTYEEARRSTTRRCKDQNQTYPDTVVREPALAYHHVVKKPQFELWIWLRQLVPQSFHYGGSTDVEIEFHGLA